MIDKAFQILQAMLEKHRHQQIAIVPKDGSLPTTYCVFTDYDKEHIYVKTIDDQQVNHNSGSEVVNLEPEELNSGSEGVSKISLSEIRHIFTAKFDNYIISNPG